VKGGWCKVEDGGSAWGCWKWRSGKGQNLEKEEKKPGKIGRGEPRGVKILSDSLREWDFDYIHTEGTIETGRWGRSGNLRCVGGNSVGPVGEEHSGWGVKKDDSPGGTFAELFGLM